MTHFEDCPYMSGYDICTCNMPGEEIALVDWQIAKQEGRQKWWHFIAKLSTHNAPDIHKRNAS